MINNISPELKKNLILSVGQHPGKRPFSPVEVAEGIEVLIDHGKSNSEISNILLLRDTSMIGRFLKLLKLSSSIKHLIDWGATGATLSFSSAVEISRLESSDQNVVAMKAFEYSLTKAEIIQLVQIKKRSGRNIGDCVEEVVNMRPKIETKYVLIGAIADDRLKNFLLKKSQYERDEIFKRTIDSVIDEKIPWEGKLGGDRFTLVGDKDLNGVLLAMEPEFETKINSQLIDEVIDE